MKYPSGILLIIFFVLLCNCKNQRTDRVPHFSTDSISVRGEVAVSQSELLITPDASNVLPIDFVRLQMKNKILRNVAVCDLNKIIGEYRGIFKVFYPFTIKDKIDFSTLKFAIGCDSVCEVRINGTTIPSIPFCFFINENYRLYEIGKYSFCGKNEVSVSFQVKRQKLTDLAYVLGAFSLQPTELGFQILHPTLLCPGEWSTQGMPFYSDAMTYSKIYTCQKGTYTYVLSLPSWKGSSAMVFVNRELVAYINDDENRLDITRYLISGENKIDIKILGIMRNTTGPFYKEDTIPKYPLGGDGYIFSPSGLYDDFTVCREG